MKIRISCLMLICALVCFSCSDDKIDPPVTFIKATLNGVETLYKTLPPDADHYNYIKPGSINIRFTRNDDSSQYWEIRIYHKYAGSDGTDLPLPFEIKGPNPDYTVTSAEAHVLILDQDGGPYGLQIAGGSTFDHEFSLTITSVDNNFIRGTFSGRGHGTFENGEFAALLPVKEW
jgi:hypothetical protein